MIHDDARQRETRPAPAAWRVVWWFGLVSLAADMVYEGARSMYGPMLAALGASAVVVGVVTGLGEATALVLRLVFGPLADRTGRYWAITILGYALTAVCVPLLWFAPRVGGVGLALAVALILLERLGKAVRSPSKSALLAHAAGAVGRGRGFGLHKALDQTGAFAGPLLVAAVVASATGTMWTGMAVLAVPGAVAMALLAWLRWRVPDPTIYDPAARASAQDPADDATPRQGWWADVVGADLPPAFFRYAFAAALTTGGLVTFGIIGYHLTTAKIVPLAAIPVVYAAAMAVEAVAALVVGAMYDRTGPRVLLVVPVLVGLVPGLALTDPTLLVMGGVLAWGVAQGVQDSTVKAVVADLVPAARRATAYGVFAGIQGGLAVAGGATVGWLYDVSLPALVVVVAATQVVALVLLASALREVRR